MKGTILVVDDSAIMRKVILRALGQAEMKFKLVLEAQNGFEALDRLSSNKVDLILCDINMPGMSGLELLRKIKRDGLAAGAPIVMVTTQSNEPQVQEALTDGAAGYIRKPFTSSQMEDTIKPLLEYRDRLDEASTGSAPK